MIQSSKAWLAGLFVAFLALCHSVKEEQLVLIKEHQSDFEEKPVTDIETLLTAQDFPDKGKKFVLIIILWPIKIDRLMIVMFYSNHAEAERSYKLVKAEIDGEAKSLPMFPIFVAKGDDHIWFAANSWNRLWGRFKKVGSDAEGELYKLNWPSETQVRVRGKGVEEEFMFFNVLYRMNRFHFRCNQKGLTSLALDVHFSIRLRLGFD